MYLSTNLAPQTIDHLIQGQNELHLQYQILNIRRGKDQKLDRDITLDRIY